MDLKVVVVVNHSVVLLCENDHHSVKESIHDENESEIVNENGTNV